MEMTTRKLMYKAMDNDPNPRLVHLMHDLSRYRHVDSMLRWLIRNNLTGNNLIQFLDYTFKSSILSMAKHIIMLVNKERKVAPVLYRKDWH